VTSQDTGRRRSSTEQLVSERGKPPVVAQDSRQDAEVRKNQVQQVASHPSSRIGDRYSCPVLFLGIHALLTRTLVQLRPQYKKIKTLQKNLLKRSMRQLG
jgi:hypothetical protein